MGRPLYAHEVEQKEKGETAFDKFIRYQSMVRNQYLKFGKKYEFSVIDTNSKNIDEVSKEIVNKILQGGELANDIIRKKYN